MGSVGSNVFFELEPYCLCCFNFHHSKKNISSPSHKQKKQRLGTTALYTTREKWSFSFSLEWADPSTPQTHTTFKGWLLTMLVHFIAEPPGQNHTNIYILMSKSLYLLINKMKLTCHSRHTPLSQHPSSIIVYILKTYSIKYIM